MCACAYACVNDVETYADFDGSRINTIWIVSYYVTIYCVVYAKGDKSDFGDLIWIFNLYDVTFMIFQISKREKEDGFI